MGPKTNAKQVVVPDSALIITEDTVGVWMAYLNGKEGYEDFIATLDEEPTKFALTVRMRLSTTGEMEMKRLTLPKLDADAREFALRGARAVANELKEQTGCEAHELLMNDERDPRKFFEDFKVKYSEWVHRVVEFP